MEELRIPVEGAVRAINYAGMATQEVNWPYCREQMYDYLQNSFLVWMMTMTMKAKSPTLQDC